MAVSCDRFGPAVSKIRSILNLVFSWSLKYYFNSRDLITKRQKNTSCQLNSAIFIRKVTRGFIFERSPKVIYLQNPWKN